eukprot:3930711-Rhodomonas_salina.3
MDGRGWGGRESKALWGVSDGTSLDVISGIMLVISISIMISSSESNNNSNSNSNSNSIRISISISIKVVIMVVGLVSSCHGSRPSEIAAESTLKLYIDTHRHECDPPRSQSVIS